MELELLVLFFQQINTWNSTTSLVTSCSNRTNIFTCSLCSVALTKNHGILCGGFEDSSVRLWSLTPKKLVKQKSKTADVSKVNLSFGKFCFMFYCYQDWWFLGILQIILAWQRLMVCNQNVAIVKDSHLLNTKEIYDW